MCRTTSNFMKFEANKYYYIHNFGIDYQNIFFSERNKTYFTKKIHKYIEPYAQIMSISLGDNQFHILIKTKENYTGNILNHNIGIMLRSYTRAINKERFRFGSLFCRHTKAFSKLSDIPKRLRNFVNPFIKYFKKGQLTNFPKTIFSFMDFINAKASKIHDLPFTFENIFKHPLEEQRKIQSLQSP